MNKDGVTVLQSKSIATSRKIGKINMFFYIIKSEWKEFYTYQNIWIYLSISDLKSRFRRSKLGIGWPVLQQLAFSIGAGIIWAAVFHLKPEDFIPFLTLGFSIWGFIAASLTEGCSSFVVAHGYLKQLPLPQSIFIFRTLLTQLIFMVIGLMTAMGILLYFGKLTMFGLFFAVPGVLILIIYAYGAIGSLAYLGLRYRDLQHGLTGILSLLFVVTPVIYPSEVLINKGIAIAIYGNPFASLIEIVRFPILNGEFASSSHYFLATLFALVLVFLRFRLGSRWSRFVAFWS
ncbi:ABC transporter permease [Endozoicomonas sp. 8E]|uniref:ABC transporter permease n=1 Tax=Endozoicomonas sp. 8E TaxID=3035692 RepID=UPI0029390AEB|nr:ABC transporter permease [Endozoicomonas sp. 8E]WOG26343.1 ABC transporter permease [Endozoicomonas sp. 8E]